MLSTFLKKKINLLRSIFQSQYEQYHKYLKGIIIKNLSSDIPKSLSYNGLTITNKVEISNIFNKYFATIAENKSLTQTFL